MVMQQCEYCGKYGCHWTNHDEAHTDVIVWAKTVEAERNR